MEIQRDNRKVMNIKRTRLLKKYNIEKKESLDQLILKSLNKRFLPRHNDYPGTGKDKTIIIKISCLELTVRNFITVFGTHTPM